MLFKSCFYQIFMILIYHFLQVILFRVSRPKIWKGFFTITPLRPYGFLLRDIRGDEKSVFEAIKCIEYTGSQTSWIRITVKKSRGPDTQHCVWKDYVFAQSELAESLIILRKIATFCKMPHWFACFIIFYLMLKVKTTHTKKLKFPVCYIIHCSFCRHFFLWRWAIWFMVLMTGDVYFLDDLSINQYECVNM